MQYIILDLEWNQPMSYQSQIYRQVGDRLIFEMIQIGAVKVDADLKVCDTISIPIRPQVYVKIHSRIRRMTHLDNEILADADLFPEAMDRFVAWCREGGEEYALLTWGCDDVSVLQQNMDYFGWHGELPPLCDIQRLFSDLYESRERMGLKAAMDRLGIEPDEDLPFHNALHDSYYTALVFATLPDPAAVLKYPQKPRPLTHQNKVHRTRMKGDLYDNVEAAITSEEATKPACPACGRALTLEPGGYVKQTADKLVAIGRCKGHGNLLVTLRLRPEDTGKCLLQLAVRRATPANVAYVHTKRIQVAEREAAYLAEHGALPDPDEALLNAERTSMPFEE